MALMMNKVQKVPYYGLLSAKYRFELLFFDSQGINWKRQSIRGLRLKKGRWLEGRFSFPKTIYNRCYPQPLEVIKKLGERIGPKNIFNTLTQIDKWEVYQHLVQSEVAEFLPMTYQYTPENLGDLIRQHSALILKPRLGYGGAGVFKITTLAPDLVTISSHFEFPIPLVSEAFYVPLLAALAPPARFIGQQYIDSFQAEDRKFDVRMVMQKNAAGEWEVGGQLARVTKAKILLTNNYATIADPQEVASLSLISAMHSLSQVVATQLDAKMGNLGEISVDFLVDQDKKPWILEVNGKPDKSLFRKLDDTRMLERVYVNPLNYQRFLMGEGAVNAPEVH